MSTKLVDIVYFDTPVKIRPLQMMFGNSGDFPECQFLLEADDLADNQRKTFAMAGITAWTQTTEDSAPAPEPVNALVQEPQASPVVSADQPV